MEDELLMPVNELPVMGKHYQANALAALAIGYGFGLPFEPMLKVLREFKGLPHRCQFVRERNGVKWYNDSKGTNVGATQAAIEGLGSEIPGKLIMIMGGLGKNADFCPLVPAIEKYSRHVVLIGEAAQDIAKALLMDVFQFLLRKLWKKQYSRLITQQNLAIAFYFHQHAPVLICLKIMNIVAKYSTERL